MPKPTEPIRITFDPDHDLYEAGISDEPDALVVADRPY